MRKRAKTPENSKKKRQIPIRIQGNDPKYLKICGLALFFEFLDISAPSF